MIFNKIPNDVKVVAKSYGTDGPAPYCYICTRDWKPMKKTPAAWQRYADREAKRMSKRDGVLWQASLFHNTEQMYVRLNYCHEYGTLRSGEKIGYGTFKINKKNIFWLTNQESCTII